jgi:hypothetical protein
MTRHTDDNVDQWVTCHRYRSQDTQGYKDPNLFNTIFNRYGSFKKPIPTVTGPGTDDLYLSLWVWIFSDMGLGTLGNTQGLPMTHKGQRQRQEKSPLTRLQMESTRICGEL